MIKEINRKNYAMNQVFKNYRICIPIIQREYVQGIKEKNGKLRENTDRLIDDILDAIDKNQKISLNIIYGFHDSKTFYPVDGQQRLTLIYLLYWYLAIRNDKLDEFLEFKELIYETRVSANEFFLFLRNNKTAEIWKYLFDSSSHNFVSNVKNMKWFKNQWAADITVISAINILEFFKQRIDKDTAVTYYNNIMSENTKICVDILSESKDEAELDANINYVRLNSRGKQLEMFENIKAALALIERKVGIQPFEMFTYKYDQKYIDIFYEDCDGNLEVKTRKINEKTSNFLENSFELWKLLYDKIQLAEQLKNIQNFTLEVYNASRNQIKIQEFWRGYFDFINIILENLYLERHLRNYVKNVWNTKILFDKNYEDKEKLVINILYMYYFFINQSSDDNEWVSLMNIEQLNYLLLNLRYSDWKQENLEVTRMFCEKLSYMKTPLSYFVETGSDDIISQIIPDSCIYNRLKIEDFKVRIKEQVIKARIINKLKETRMVSFGNSVIYFKYFDDLEKKSGRRQIYYFLYISDLWFDENKVTIEKIELLLKYINHTKKYQYSDIIEWRRWFAIAAYFDEKYKKLFSADEINRILNEGSRRYFDDNLKKYELLSDENLHNWKTDFYYLKDNIEEKHRNLLESKLKILKRAYDIIINLRPEKENEYIKDIFGMEYNQCWLKYVIDRGYIELYINKISYNDASGKVEIIIDQKNEWGNTIEKTRGDIFAFIFALDKKQADQKYRINCHYTSIYDLSSKNVRDTACREKYTLYEDSIKIINQFSLNLSWENEVIFDSGWGRNFYYYKYNINFNGDGETLYILEKDIITVYCFCNNEYDEFILDISKIKNEISEYIKSYYVAYSEIKNYIVDRDNIERDKLIVKQLIDKYFDCKNYYSKNNENIHKYLLKSSRTYLFGKKDLENKEVNGHNILNFKNFN